MSVLQINHKEQSMKITQIRNATIIIEYNNTKFLIDPWLSPKDSMAGFEGAINSNIRQPRVELPFSIDKITNADVVIVTHVHPDHWDEYAEKAINKEIKLFVQSETDKNYLTSKGFNNVEVLLSGGINYNGIELYKTGCQHGRREVVEPICKQLNMPYDSMGVIFKARGEKTLYLAGDTIYCEEVEEAIKEFDPQIIIVNACGATLLNGEKIIMTDKDIRKVIAQAPSATIIASHMDTVSHLSVTRADLKQYARTESIDNLLIPEDGETIIINN